MSDVPQAQPGQLMSLGAVASHNIAAALNLAPEKAAEIETAIKDEIDTMSAHFTLVFADIQTQYEAETLKLKTECEGIVKTVKAKLVAEVAEIKSTYKFFEDNQTQIIAIGIILFGIGAFVGTIVSHFA